MIKIPNDAERLMNKLPQAVLDEIQLEMILWSGIAMMEMDSREPSEKQFKKHMKRTMKKHIGLLRKAETRLDKGGSV
jgi:hypothetical protein